MTNGKAAGVDSVIAELLKPDTDTAVTKQDQERKFPQDWNRGVIVMIILIVDYEKAFEQCLS